MLGRSVSLMSVEKKEGIEMNFVYRVTRHR